MKRLLIISPYFPPSNAADMHRVRMSLPYLKEFGWEPTVVTVDPQYSDLAKDELLNNSVPKDIEVIYVKAFDKKYTSKFGLGSIALRSLYFYQKNVSELLLVRKFDLIYFSTTQFPVCVLGAVWKRKFGIPYVLDFQDPWFSSYYDDKPKAQRPRKHWFSYRLNKYLEPIAVKNCDGLISVSEKYITDLKNRYPQISAILSSIIIFGASEIDRQIAIKFQHFPQILSPEHKNLVYVGRGGYDMHQAMKPLFEAISLLIKKNPEYKEQLKLYFIGTSYATQDTGMPTIEPLAKRYGLQTVVKELTNRIGYYHALFTLNNADALFIPGSDDPAYVASKSLPFIYTRKPILAIINSKSPALKLFSDFQINTAYSWDTDFSLVEKIEDFITQLLKGNNSAPIYDKEVLEAYEARNLTKKQTDLFDKVIHRKFAQKKCD